jgi:hypothetical protein
MPIERYRKETLPPDVDQGGGISRNLDRLEALSRSLEDVRFLDGELLEDVAYAGSAVTLAHGLKRKWRGYIATKVSAAETIVATDANNPEDNKATQIVFTASGNVTFDAWVF